MRDAVATPANDAADSFPPQQPVEKTWRRSFWALVITQFQGAFSANVLRYLLTFMVVGMTLTDARRDSLVSLIAFLFFVPLVVFSMAGGFVADGFSKRQVTIATKLIEIAAMVVAIFALSASQKEQLGHVVDLWQHPAALLTHFPLPLVVLFVVAMQAALFGPAKYGLLPELLPEKWLSWATASSSWAHSWPSFRGPWRRAGLPRLLKGTNPMPESSWWGLRFWAWLPASLSPRLLLRRPGRDSARTF